jgi:hypothetical protein
MPRGEEIPLLPEAASIYKQRILQSGNGSPSSVCLPHGVPYAMLVQQMKIVQTPRLTLILYEEFNDFRQVFTDGRRCRSIRSRRGTVTLWAGGTAIRL